MIKLPPAKHVLAASLIVLAACNIMHAKTKHDRDQLILEVEQLKGRRVLVSFQNEIEPMVIPINNTTYLTGYGMIVSNIAGQDIVFRVGKGAE